MKNSAKICLLVAEDDENDVFLLQRAFQDAGITDPVHVVSDGQETIEYLSGAGEYSDRNRHPLPCLLILDLKMPRKTGIDVLEWIRRQPGLQCLPVMVFSSSAQRDDVERAYRYGANAFVVKPASTEQRSELARFIKGFWILFNQPPLLCVEGLQTAREFHAKES